MCRVEMASQGGDVVTHGFELERSVSIRGAAMALELDRDHLAMACKRLDQRCHLADGHETSMQKDQRVTLAVYFVLELHSVRSPRCRMRVRASITNARPENTTFSIPKLSAN
jgi:hypothetical protein